MFATVKSLARSLVILLFLTLTWLAAAPAAHAQDTALLFSGIQDFVYIAPDPALDLKGSITVSAWVKFDGVDRQQAQIFWRGDTHSGLDPYALAINDDGKVYFELDFSNSNYVRIIAPEALDTAYQFWSGVYDAVNAKAYLYRDGVLQASADTSGTLEYTTSNMWNIIGAVDNGNWQFFGGLIDEVMVWSEARTPAQLLQDRTGEVTGNEPGLAGYWRFNEGSGQAAGDSTSNGNAGRLGTSTGQDDADPLWVVAAPLPTPQPIPDIAQGLVSWWPGDGGTEDATGPNDGALLDGAGFAPTNTGQAFSFNGDGAYFDAPTQNLPTGNSDRTLSLWVKVRAFNNEQSAFGGYGNFGTERQVFGVGTLITNNGHRLYFTQWGESFLGPRLETRTWYQVAAKQVHGVQTLYLNGSPVAQGSLTVQTPAGGRLNVGSIAGGLGVSRSLDGLVSDVRIYNRGLSDAEMQTLYANGLPTHPGSNIFVLSPNGGENYVGGTWIDAEWQTDLLDAGSAVDFELWNGSGRVAHLGTDWDPAGEGTTPLYLPLLPARLDYRLRVISLWDPTLYDESDQPFTISGGPVRVLKPNGGETWTAGMPMLVQWRMGIPSAGTALEIELWNARELVADLGPVWNPDGTGVDWFTLPIVPNGTDYRIKAVSLWNEFYTDLSDGPFTITGGTPDRSAVDGQSWLLY